MLTPPQDISLDQADAKTIEAYAQKLGLEPGALITMAVRALAERIRSSGGRLVMPIEIAPIAPHCLTCPLAHQRAALAQETAPPLKIVPGPW